MSEVHTRSSTHNIQIENKSFLKVIICHVVRVLTRARIACELRGCVYMCLADQYLGDDRLQNGGDRVGAKRNTLILPVERE